MLRRPQTLNILIFNMFAMSGQLCDMCPYLPTLSEETILIQKPEITSLKTIGETGVVERDFKTPLGILYSQKD